MNAFAGMWELIRFAAAQRISYAVISGRSWDRNVLFRIDVSSVASDTFIGSVELQELRHQVFDEFNIELSTHCVVQPMYSFIHIAP